MYLRWTLVKHEQPLSHSNRCVTATVWIQLIIFPRLANVPAWWTATSWRVRVTPDRRQKLNPRRTSARPTIFTLDLSAISMGCRERLLGIKTREVSGLDLSPSLFIYYLFLQSSLVFFFRPLPPSSSTPPCFLFFFLLFTWGSVHCTICWLLLHLATVASPLLYFSPQPSRSSREPIKVLRLSEHSGRVLVTMVTPYQITATGGRRRLCDVRMNQRRELTKRKSFAASQLLRAREVCTMSKVMNFRYSLLLISSLFFLSISPLETWGGERRTERDMV